MTNIFNRSLLIILTILFAQANGKSQSYSDSDNDTVLLKKIGVKSIITRIYPDKNYEPLKGKVLSKIDYDKSGKILKLYRLSIFDVVSNDNTTTYKYNKEGQLIEKISLQNTLNLLKRDKKFIKKLGGDPINEMWRYAYTDENNIIESHYYLDKDAQLKSENPSNTIFYKYKKGKLIEKIGKSKNPNSGDNFNKIYTYNSDGNLIQMVNKNELTPSMSDTTLYGYNVKGNLITEKLKSFIEFFNSSLKYEYNNENQLIKKFKYNNDQDKWNELESITYSSKGQKNTRGDINYEYFENGLIKNEIFIDPVSKEMYLKYETSYEFY